MVQIVNIYKIEYSAKFKRFSTPFIELFKTFFVHQSDKCWGINDEDIFLASLNCMSFCFEKTWRKRERLKKWVRKSFACDFFPKCHISLNLLLFWRHLLYPIVVVLSFFPIHLLWLFYTTKVVGRKKRWNFSSFSLITFFLHLFF